ncbi:MAG TPA: Sir2 family NAD-dependent protein deacetylase [Polyangiaceae bacterium]|nr:Sir2 family NAD-dependent protein deacetylase [Polyangiaceae bacterium]
MEISFESRATMHLETIVEHWRLRGGRLVFLTGAGISAESGIPTFRGSDGFWRVGSKNYAPMDLATRAMFDRDPELVWSWYLARFAACAAATPNAGHRAIAQIQAAYGDRVALVTQNIDGLHFRAGSPPERSFAIHGDARLVRCALGCAAVMTPIPAVEPAAPEKRLSTRTRDLLRCARCSSWMRPHVLWFDEMYDEHNYRSESALSAARSASLLVTVGSTGATTLPMRIALECHARAVPIIDINIEENPFAQLADECGHSVRETATTALPRIATLLGVS